MIIIHIFVATFKCTVHTKYSANWTENINCKYLYMYVSTFERVKEERCRIEGKSTNCKEKLRKEYNREKNAVTFQILFLLYLKKEMSII